MHTWPDLGCVGRTGRGVNDDFARLSNSRWGRLRGLRDPREQIAEEDGTPQSYGRRALDIARGLAGLAVADSSGGGDEGMRIQRW